MSIKNFVGIFTGFLLILNSSGFAASASKALVVAAEEAALALSKSEVLSSLPSGTQRTVRALAIGKDITANAKAAHAKDLETALASLPKDVFAKVMAVPGVQRLKKASAILVAKMNAAESATTAPIVVGQNAPVPSTGTVARPGAGAQAPVAPMVAGRATGGATSTAAAGLTAKFKKAVEEGRSLIGDDQVLRALETRFPQFAETIGQIGELNLTAAEGVLIGKRLITEATCLAKMEAASAKSALDDLLAAGLAIKDARMAGLNLDRATVKGACAAFGSIALRTGLNAAAAAKQGAEAIRICNTGPEALSLVPGSACPVKK